MHILALFSFLPSCADLFLADFAVRMATAMHNIDCLSEVTDAPFKRSADGVPAEITPANAVSVV